jgi:imidazolonepropionase-like amidohydrolase
LQTSLRIWTPLALAGLVAGSPATALGRPVAIRNATIFPVVAAPIERGTIVFDKGVIVAIGRDIAVPSDAEVVDGTGLFVMPGIVDPHSHLGVASWPSVPANNDTSEATDPITPQVRVVDGFNVDDPAIKRVVAAGVTTMQVFPGSTNVIGGEGAVFKLKVGGTLSEMLFPGAPRLMKMAMGENPKATYGSKGLLPATRSGIFALLRDAFTRAREYRERWDRWESQPAEGRGPAPPRDLKLEPLAEILRGRMRVHIHCYRKDEFLTLLRISDEFGFKITSFQHAMESYKVVEELARRGVAVSVYPDAFGRKIEHWNQIPQNAAFMIAGGVLTTLHSDFPFFAQRLYTEAAKLIKYGGLSEDQALQTITLSPARLIGVDKWVGSLEVGKQADIAVFNRHPFDSFALCQKTYIDGDLVFDRERDKAWVGGRRQ